MSSQTWYYHPIHGGHLFDTSSPPDPALGWFDHRNFDGLEIDPAWNIPLEAALVLPVKSAEQLEDEASRSDEPELADPTLFEDVDAYMAEFVSRLAAGLEPADRDKQLKRAMEHFANVNYALGIDRRKSVEKIAIEIRTHAEAKKK